MVQYQNCHNIVFAKDGVTGSSSGGSYKLRMTTFLFIVYNSFPVKHLKKEIGLLIKHDTYAKNNI